MTNNVSGEVGNVQKPMDQPMLLQNPNRTQKPLPYIYYTAVALGNVSCHHGKLIAMETMKP